MNINIGKIKGVILSAREIIVPPTPTGHIYGVDWNRQPSISLIRTDDSSNFADPNPYVAGATEYGSPFDNLMPWSGIERVSDPNAGELVKIPKFWFKLEISNEHPFKLQISDQAREGFFVAPAFMDRGDGKGERDYVYVGRYHCSSLNYKSASGVTPKVSLTRADFRTNIHNLGSTIWQWDYAMLITIQMLYIVEFANWHSQAVIGAGCSQTSARSSEVFVCGGTDSMPYHTGTVSANHTDYGDCQYRYIENLWGNCNDWIDGIYLNTANIYIVKNPANFSETPSGILVGTRPEQDGYILKLAKSNVSGFDWFYYPSMTTDDRNQAVVPDYYYRAYNNNAQRTGGYFYQDRYSGLFCLRGDYRASESSNWCGSRLMVLP